MSEEEFPHPGTDRREDELARNLKVERDAVKSEERAVETDRVADKDRRSEDLRTGTLEELVVKQKKQIDLLAVAILIILLLGFAISVSSWVTARSAKKVSQRVEANAASVDQFCNLVISVHVDRVRRLVNSISYLDSPIGRDNPGIANALKASLSATRSVAIQERATLPHVCVAGRKLPEIPKLPPS